MRFLAAVLTLAIGIAFLPGVSQAHKVNLFAYEENGTVFTESYFGDGIPCRAAKITAQDENGTVIAEGVTNEEGVFSFPYGKEGDLHLILRAGMGHGARITFATNEKNDGNESPERKEGAGPVGKGEGISPPVSADDVDRIVESKIAPLRDSLREIQKNLGKPTFPKVMGGIGWIVGIAGAYLWGVSRKSRREKEKG